MGEIVAAVGTCHTPYMFTRPPDENPQQLDAGGRRDAGARHGPRRDQAGRRSCFSAAITSRRFRSTCVPTLRHHRRQPRRSPSSPAASINLPVHREMAEDLLNKLVVEHRLRHRVLGRRRARPRVRRAVRVRDRQARHPGDSVLHQRLRAAAADAETLRGARAGDRARSSRAARSASRSSRAAGMSHFPGTTKYLHARVRFRPLAASRSSRPATPTRC